MGLYIRFHGWFGFALFCTCLFWVLWLRSTDEGLEFQKEHSLLLSLPSILYVAVYVGWCLWVATLEIEHKNGEGVRRYKSSEGMGQSLRIVRARATH